MSRIGQKPITLPEKVKVNVQGQLISVEGPKGKTSVKIPALMAVKVEKNLVTVQRPDESRQARSLHGLSRTLVANAIEGVTKGFERVLDISGVGFRADLQGKVINFALGYSHPIAFPLPDGVTAEVEKQVKVTLRGSDKHMLGLTAAAIRKLRKPEPYKGKGIKYQEETIRRKVGKTGAA